MPSDLESPTAPAARPSLTPFWTIYDRLIAGVPAGLSADGFAAGLHWFGLRAGGAIGMAMAPREGYDSPTLAGSIAGRSLGELADLAKSWNLADAALGVAALNAAYNRADRLEAWLASGGHAACAANAFTHFRPRLVGKRVAIIGHFRALAPLASLCELTILERRPQPGDLPDPACEVVLPSSDFVFITATTLINKTLPRLLELSRGATVILVGPTTPLTPLWFDLGVAAIAGLVVPGDSDAWRIVQEGGQHEFFNRGARMVLVEKPDLVS